MVTFNDWHSSTAHDCLTSAAKQVKQRKNLNDVFKCVHHERPEYCCLTFGLDILVGNFESYDVNFLNIITNETSLLHMISPFYILFIDLYLLYLLMPISLIAVAGGPINITPSLSQSSANSGFSDKKP